MVNPDILIRTGGKRKDLVIFYFGKWLTQSFILSNKLWPDFKINDFLK